MGAFFEVDDAEFQAWAKRVEAKANDAVLKAELQKSLKRVGVQAQRIVKAHTPTVTSNLRRGWNIANAGVMAIELYNNVEYAPYVEHGHRQTPGRYVPAIHARLKASWVPGKHMLMTTLFELEDMLPGLITPELAKALEGMLD